MDNLGFSPTNTMALASFDALKMDAIEDPLIDINKLATLDLDESYTLEAVDFIKSVQEEFTNAKITLYTGITEATTQDSLLESFSGFFVTVKDIIDKFLAFIKVLFDKCCISLTNAIKGDKYITQNKNQFKEFKDEYSFPMHGYNYTIDNDIPTADAVLTTSLIFNNVGKDNNGIINVDTVRDSANMDKNELYDKFRAKVLGKSDVIYYTEFKDELFKIFRDGQMDTIDLNVNKAMVDNAFDVIINYKKLKDMINDDKVKIIKAYKKLEDEVKCITKRNGDLNVDAFIKAFPDSAGVKGIDPKDTNNGVMMSGDMMMYINIYVKNKVDVIQECSNIHLLAYSAKLDAISNCVKQNKVILYSAMNRIQYNTGKEGK